MISPRAKVIEDFGLFFEAYGIARIVGRIYGAFLITDAPFIGLDDLAKQLEISKASASTGVRQLLGYKMIKKISVPGDRRDYYHVSPDAHIEYLQMNIQGALSFARLIQAATHLGDLSPPAQAKLERLEHLYEALGAHIEVFFREYRFEEPLVKTSKP
jgi:DNA-binding transcriptional regulator GbsR (MarR family)